LRSRLPPSVGQPILSITGPAGTVFINLIRMTVIPLIAYARRERRVAGGVRCYGVLGCAP
jgi:hypothetical protein